jgi:hypothetical protein
VAHICSGDNWESAVQRTQGEHPRQLGAQGGDGILIVDIDNVDVAIRHVHNLRIAPQIFSLVIEIRELVQPIRSRLAGCGK